MRYTVNILNSDGFPGVSYSTAEIAECDAPDAIDALRATYPTNNSVAYSTFDRSTLYTYEFEFGPRLYFPPMVAK